MPATECGAGVKVAFSIIGFLEVCMIDKTFGIFPVLEKALEQHEKQLSQTNMAEIKESYSPTGVGVLINRIALDIGRRTGKSASIAYLSTDRDLIIVPKATDVDDFLLFNPSAKVVSSTQVLRQVDPAEQTFDTVWFDNASFFRAGEVVELVTRFCTKAHVPRFVLLG